MLRRVVISFLFVSHQCFFSPNSAVAADQILAADTSQYEFVQLKEGEIPHRDDLTAIKQHILDNPGIYEEIVNEGRIRIILDKARAKDIPIIERDILKVLEEIGIETEKSSGSDKKEILVKFEIIDWRHASESAKQEVMRDLFEEEKVIQLELSGVLENIISLSLGKQKTIQNEYEIFSDVLLGQVVTSALRQKLKEKNSLYKTAATLKEKNEIMADVLSLVINFTNETEKNLETPVQGIEIKVIRKHIITFLEKTKLAKSVILALEQRWENKYSTSDASVEHNLSAQEKVEVLTKKQMRKAFHERLLGFFALPLKVPYYAAKEVSFLAKTLWKSIAIPSKAEIIAGISSKAYPFAVGMAQYVHAYWDNPIGLIAASSLSLALDTFHGVFASTWLNFQDRLNKVRGTRYQTIFNFAYGNLWGICFRTIAWAAGVAKNSPISMEFISVALTAGLTGTIMGTKGYQGLNKLAEMGVISYKTRNLILQLKDIPFMIGGTQFGLGNTKLWALCFLLEHGPNLGFYVASVSKSQKPMLVIAPKNIIDSPDFELQYPNVVQLDEIPVNKKGFIQTLKFIAKDIADDFLPKLKFLENMKQKRTLKRLEKNGFGGPCAQIFAVI